MNKRHKKNTGAIIIIAVLIMMMTMMDVITVFNMTTRQIRETGSFKLSTISGALESTISEAENHTMKLAMEAQGLLDNKLELKEYIYDKKKELIDEGKGVLNIYIAGPGWDIVPDFDTRTDDFVATERSWYTGAIRSHGSTNVTPPYVDVVTGKVCYTVSVMLADKETVIGVDYTMDTIRAHILQMYENGSREAVIVTGEGIIAGCSDDSLVRERLNDVLPQYSGIYTLAKNSEGVVNARIKSGLFYENLFATKSGAGWYLIVCESDWELYKRSYIQLIVTLVLTVTLFALIIILYSSTMKSRQKAEDALASKEAFLNGISGELKNPLKKIMDSSSADNARQTEDYYAEFAAIHEAGEKLSEMLGQLFSYSSIVQKQTDSEQESKHLMKGRMSSRVRGGIVCVMLLVMALSLYANIQATYNWGKTQLKNEVSDYEYQLSSWVDTQKSILDMFSSVISTNPEMLDDYYGTIAYLDRIKQQYPEISVVYMTSPNLEPTVYMNNGWNFGEDWILEERPWYIDTMASETGWSVSAPYYDAQTGLYCITISERVFEYATGEDLGVFAIDFYMDKLVDILGSSYSSDSYAFLVDGGGNIINHPYGSYQMSVDNTCNVSTLPYGEIRPDGESTLMFKDYDGTYRLLMAERNTDSGFTVYVVSSIWSIFGKVLINGLICLVAFLACIIMVYRMLTDMMAWQEEANERLKVAADKAIAAGRAKGQFLAQMSHEIRTPINAVLGMNEMILRESSDEHILDYSENIQSAGKTLLALINSILDFSKIEDGKMEIISVKYETAGMINNLVNSIKSRAENAGLEFIVNVDEMLPSQLFGDDVRLTQVIMNLLTNAVKYTESGSVTLSLKTIDHRDADVDIYVEVKDTGIGIKKEDMDKLYASFERIEEQRNRNIEGTGLGMSIVTKLLKMMDSELKVDSVYGVGSCFSFVIKQGIVDKTPLGDYAKRLMERRDHTGDKKKIKIDGARILVVDDNAMNIKVASNFLRLYGIEADTASSGDEAIKLCSSKQYDIVFLDHMMPKMDGIETLAKIRDKKLLPENTVVIALTANAVVGAKETYLSAGFDDYLSKPLEVDALEEKLLKHLPKSVLERSSVKNTGSSGADKRKAAADTAKGSNGADKKKTEPDYREETDERGYTLIEFNFDDDKDGENASEADGTKAGKGKDIIAALNEAGISTDDGLRYCAGSEEFYIEVLNDLVEAYDEKKEMLCSYYEQKQIKDYETQVHALKSSLKTVGAMKESEQARDLETAAKNGDTEYMEKNHEAFIADYTALVNRLRELLKA